MQNGDRILPDTVPACGSPGQESRTARRNRVLKSATAAFNLQFSSVPCILRNVSETGARLEFGDSTLPPAKFTLHVELDGYKIDCERVWQDGKNCGVRFCGEKIPTRVLRSQVLGSSENALSERVMREIETRTKAEKTPVPVAGPSSAGLAPAPPARSAGKPSFGKRVQ